MSRRAHDLEGTLLDMIGTRWSEDNSLQDVPTPSNLCVNESQNLTRTSLTPLFYFLFFPYLVWSCQLLLSYFLRFNFHCFVLVSLLLFSILVGLPPPSLSLSAALLSLSSIARSILPTLARAGVAQRPHLATVACAAD